MSLCDYLANRLRSTGKAPYCCFYSIGALAFLGTLRIPLIEVCMAFGAVYACKHNLLKALKKRFYKGLSAVQKGTFATLTHVC